MSECIVGELLFIDKLRNALYSTASTANGVLQQLWFIAIYILSLEQCGLMKKKIN